MLEESEAYWAAHKPLCMCAYMYAYKCVHTQKRSQFTVEVPFIFPKGNCCANITVTAL